MNKISWNKPTKEQVEHWNKIILEIKKDIFKNNMKKCKDREKIRASI